MKANVLTVHIGITNTSHYQAMLQCQENTKGRVQLNNQVVLTTKTQGLKRTQKTLKKFFTGVPQTSNFFVIF